MSTKIKVLHIIPKFGTGGAERLVLDLLENSDTENFDVAAVSLYAETGTLFEREIRNKNLKVYYLDKHRGADFSMVYKLKRIFRMFRPDIIHTHLYVLRYVLLPARLEQVPVMVHTLHNLADKEVDAFGKVVGHVAFNLLGVVPVSISNEVVKSFHMVYGKKVYTPVIYNGVDTKVFAEASVLCRREEQGNVNLLHIGRFAPQKNHRLLIQAFSFALRKYPNLRLQLVGDGELRTMIENLAVELGIDGKVEFLGLRSDIPELLAQADIFVLSSDWEGMPLSVLEAMASGKPVIATAVGGVPELVENGITGVLVPPSDPDALANAVVNLAKDPEKRASLGAMAQKVAMERFDISRTTHEYEELYRKLLGKRR